MGKEKFDDLDRGGHLDVLSLIPIEFRHEVIQNCRSFPIKKGHILWNQGDKAEYVAFLLEGKLMSSYLGPNGKMSVTGVWVSGDILGASDLGGSATRLMTVRCHEDSVVCTLSMEKFISIITSTPEVSQAFIKALAIRLRWVARLEAALKMQTSFERVCCVLLALAETFGIPSHDRTLIDLRLTHSDLAAMVGTSRQTMNVTLHDLERKGAINLQHRTITITDEHELKTLAGSL
jgi:CRP/FNR family transcriptional regulator, cyclic AMP receptor protein